MVPELVKLLGGNPEAEIHESTEFDRLYIVSISGEGCISSVLLRYGRFCNAD